jgi:hypothetical protein
MYLLILFLPFLNFIFSCLFGRLVGSFIKILFVFNMFLLTIISFFLFYEVGVEKYTCFVDLGA